ncbi:granulin a [Cheilinus undulatus]|uniref:granulin a n=1 Tax=Cheilinus undulatus TaxID=241271 RepID=UPI001BD5D049|nr:granulin a [Cheilinus undulatus]
MQRWVVICAFLTLVSAHECPDGGRCEVGHTCCHDPANGYECCPFEQAECCEDHDHCCPAGMLCDTATSSCMNSTVSIPWIERSDANTPQKSKSFRMIKSYIGEEDDNICPDQSRCPAEFSCLRALTKFGCCPLAQGVPCPDGKHCCPEGHQCSADCRSCIKKEFVATVLCGDKVSECPDGTTCCETPSGKWGCCPMPNAVCCSDKLHCCPEGNACDLEHSKCISPLTKKVTPMWAKFPARIREEWEDKKEGEVTAQTVHDEKPPEVTTANTVPPTEKEVPSLSVSQAAPGNDVPCNSTVACQDGTTCCKTREGEWACCPLPEAVCCEDFIHCCPKGKKCNLAAQTCDDEKCSGPMVEKVPTIPLQGARVGDVPCNDTQSCPDGTTCCKKESGDWGCCPLPKAVCCEDHEHCCPEGTTCDLTTFSCQKGSASTPMQKKFPPFSTMATTPLQPASQSTGVATTLQTTAEYKEEPKTEEGKGTVQCDPHTSCPHSATCCFMKSAQKYGCCPLPYAVCCSDGSHCCPTGYKCSEHQTCTKGEVVIPWYTKIPAITRVPSYPGSVHCDDQSQCPDHTTCCQLSTGQWGCCPLEEAVCCQDKKHCCPEGYTCDLASGSCQKLIMLQLEMVPLTLVLLPEPVPRLPHSEHRDVKCDDTTSCEDGQTCCKMSATTWGCCPLPDAVCCSDRLHCCPKGYTCNAAGDCIQDTALSWQDWRMFSNNKKRALIV